MVHQVVPHLEEVAAVEILVGDRGVGERRDQVLAAHVRRLHTAALGHHVDGALHGEAGRQLAEGAGRRETGLVGDGDLHLDVADRPVISVGKLDRAEEGHEEAPIDPLAAVAAVREAAVADREQLAVLRGRDLEVVDLVALLAHRHQMLLAALDPADRAAQGLGQVGDQDRLAVEGRLDAEAAALVARRDDAHLLRRDVEDIGQRQPVDMRALGGEPAGHAVGLVPFEERAAGLHRRDAAAVAGEALAHHDIGAVEGLLDLGLVRGLAVGVGAAGKIHLEDDVVVPALVDDGRAFLERALGIADIGERVVVHHDGLDRVLGDIGVARDHRRHRLAVPLHLAHGQRPVGGVGGGQRRLHHRLRHGQDLVLDVVPGDDRDHARHRLGGARVDALDAGMRVVAALEHQMQRARLHDVGEEASPAGGEAMVFLAAEPGADPAFARPGHPLLLRHLAALAASRTASTMCA